MAQTIEGFVGSSLDEAKISPLHVKVIALIAAGYFFDVIDLIVLGSLIPDMVQSKFATAAEAALVGSATVFGMFIGAAGQGEFSDRWGRRFVYQFNLLLFGTFTILGALAPNVLLLGAARFIARIGLGAEQPLAFAYAGEYAPKRIRGRILAIVHFIGGACVWPIASLLRACIGIWLGGGRWSAGNREAATSEAASASHRGPWAAAEAVVERTSGHGRAAVRRLPGLADGAEALRLSIVRSVGASASTATRTWDNAPD